MTLSAVRDELVDSWPEPDDPAFVAAVAEASLHLLPSRGWTRVLVLGTGTRDAAELLVRRGYDVHETLESAGGEVDIVLCYDPASIGATAVAVAASLHSQLRKRGVLLGGPAFAEALVELKQQGFEVVRKLDSPFPALQRRTLRLRL